MEQKIKFDLTIDEANLVLASLAKMPFEQVFNLIGKLKQQADEQMNNTPRTMPLPDSK